MNKRVTESKRLKIFFVTNDLLQFICKQLVSQLKAHDWFVNLQKQNVMVAYITTNTTVKKLQNLQVFHEEDVSMITEDKRC